ncbi:MAG TPA: hypothetical protein VGD65_18480 [Chryseosolibacter sp.]
MKDDFSVMETEGELTVTIPFRGSPWGILLMTLWCLLWVILFYKFISEDLLIQHDGLYIHVIWFFILWLFVLRILLWNVRGKERLILNYTHLKIKRTGTFLTIERKYELNLIDKFRYTDVIDVPHLMWRLGLAGGYVTFNYWDRPEYVGRTVTKKEAEKIAVLLNNWLEENFRHQVDPSESDTY